MTVRQLLSRASSAELTEWMAYYTLLEREAEVARRRAEQAPHLGGR